MVVMIRSLATRMWQNSTVASALARHEPMRPSQDERRQALVQSLTLCHPELSTAVRESNRRRGEGPLHLCRHTLQLRSAREVRWPRSNTGGIACQTKNTALRRLTSASLSERKRRKRVGNPELLTPAPVTIRCRATPLSRCSANPRPGPASARYAQKSNRYSNRRERTEYGADLVQ